MYGNMKRRETMPPIRLKIGDPFDQVKRTIKCAQFLFLSMTQYGSVLQTNTKITVCYGNFEWSKDCKFVTVI